MNIQCLTVGLLDENCYLVMSETDESCFVVDPGDEASRILEQIGERRVEGVLLTHAHFDHIGAVDEICEKKQAPVYVHELDAAKLSDIRFNESIAFGMVQRTSSVPCFLKDEQVLSLCGASVKVMHTPGHSAGSVCYLLNGDEAIFTGDTLFEDAYGRTDFQDGSFQDIRISLKRLFHLSPRRPAYPGHGASFFVGGKL